MTIPAITKKIDTVIRFLFYVLIFFIPYSKAVVETAVVMSCLLWIVKHSLFLVEARSKAKKNTSFLYDLGTAFCPAHNVLNQGIALYLLICFLSILGSLRPMQSLNGFLTKTIEGYAIYLIILEVFTIRRHVKTAILIFAATALLTGMDALVQYYFTHVDLFRHRSLIEGYRATASFLHPNLFGAFLTVAILVVLGLLMAAKKLKSRTTFILTVTSFILMWALFLTFSRGAWTATVIGIIFFILIMLGRRINLMVRRVLFVFALVAGLLFVTQAFEIKKQMNVIKNDAATAQWRVDLWRAGLELVKERPFFGHGLNTFMPVMEDHLISTRNSLAVGYSASYAHNCYLQMAVEVGVLGLGGFLALIFILFRKVLSALPAHKESRMWSMGILSGLLAFLIHSAVDINFYSLELPLLFWYMAGLVISLDKQLSDKTSYAIK